MPMIFCGGKTRYWVGEKMAYSHYGCPTGALLEFLRARGTTDRFGRRDFAAALLVVFAAVLSWNYQGLHAWMVGGV